MAFERCLVISAASFPCSSPPGLAGMKSHFRLLSWWRTSPFDGPGLSRRVPLRSPGISGVIAPRSHPRGLNPNREVRRPPSLYAVGQSLGPWRKLTGACSIRIAWVSAVQIPVTLSSSSSCAIVPDGHCDAAGWPRHIAGQTVRDGVWLTWKIGRIGRQAALAVLPSVLSTQCPSSFRMSALYVKSLCTYSAAVPKGTHKGGGILPSQSHRHGECALWLPDVLLCPEMTI